MLRHILILAEPTVGEAQDEAAGLSLADRSEIATMSDKSPLFVSAMELLAHATELYTLGNERKYKFVLLHLANAIELILKDRLIDKGVSIYVPKKPQTIGIWESFDQLANVGVSVPERPVMELLIDDRNTIQHRFGFPNAQTVYYYLEQVVTFFRRFLDNEYGVDLADVLKDHLSRENLSILGLVEKAGDEEAALDRLFALSPASAVLQAFNLIESRFFALMGMKPFGRRPPPIFWRDPAFPHLLNDLALEGYISPESVEQFRLLYEMRNRAAHAAHFEGDETSPDWAEAMKVAKDLLRGLERAIQEDFAATRTERLKRSEGLLPEESEGSSKRDQETD